MTPHIQGGINRLAVLVGVLTAVTFLGWILFAVSDPEWLNVVISAAVFYIVGWGASA